MASEEVNVVAIMYPKSGKHDELSRHISELTRQVHATEPDTLIYYAFSIKDGNEIMVVERYRDQDALHMHLLSPHFQEFGSKAAGLMERPYDVKVGHGILPSSVGVTRVQS
ncbi:antibiotic biosynthesis monooxygenase [Aspergillus flavus]|uniref:Antibiotic biosynthesis monooxygenase n=3 Tax=Aspergillus subgen. Circumdati TaxID=2720871 RepID=B8NUY8_ASPFN|nr:uncharacterized protein G4B84_009463 [Aspergillus flavus NRRL3357]KAB8240798.1 hypothetical protein BDV35DRAFT_398319 [Aspergillus flavus]KOC08302.1 hypothetical protein AFLA70_715g000280 [Aspergillus flavus AF70]OOO08803.1 Antibiotic biosynthesis monooxygenase [Aspergillus oryzae]KAF7623228.1 hypothetical protein AFLA_010532 [Aspergillus flavus NRRL3357]QMW33997.1 hypothetical protein G4B84_009463 [Aspergillus flavus NRRL3357]